MAAALGVAAGIVLLVGASGEAGRVFAQAPVAPERDLAAARKSLEQGDGIAAEMTLRSALDKGVGRESVAALMGRAYLAQNDLPHAREWLAAGKFAPETALEGWRALAQLSRLDGNPDRARQALDEALTLAPGNAEVWIDLARLRYARGQHLAAIEAGERGLELAPSNVRALQFNGQVVRDRFGLAAALPWFEKALDYAPKDVPVLLDMASTLAEMGRASEALTRTREVLAQDPGNARAYYVQSVIAARAGNYALARRLLMLTRGKLDDLPGVMLLHGTLELASANPAAASEALEALLRVKPDSRRAKDLLASAIWQSGEYRYLTLRFAEDVKRGDASPYLLTTVARAYEVLGERMRAGELLDKAARLRGATLRVVGSGSRIGNLLASGNARMARNEAEAALRADPGFYDNPSLAGDARMALGDPKGAQERYRLAARIRMPESLFLRRYEAFAGAGDLQGAAVLVNDYLAQHPASRSAWRVAAGLAASSQDYARSAAILRWLRDTGDSADVALLSQLAVVEVALGEADAGIADAQRAYGLQRSSPMASQALAYALVVKRERPAAAQALLDKAQGMIGQTSLINEARAMLEGRSGRRVNTAPSR